MSMDAHRKNGESNKLQKTERKREREKKTEYLNK